jgi:hypothetical protein
MDRINKIIFRIGKKKPVEWDLTTLPILNLPLIGPIEVTWTTRPIYSDKVSDYIGFMYWNGNELIQLEPQSPWNPCYPLLLSGQPVLVSGVAYKISFIEPFILSPSRIFSPWEGMIGFSYYGWSCFRYLCETR